jgi:translation initiation factor 1A
MPNIKGGKNYKKGKGSTDDGPAFIDKQDDQLYGRVIKNLGNCNMIVYCDDNRRRFCHIRGAIRRRVWMNPGDIVLISVREFEKVEDGEMERGDIIAKYDARHYGRLKKQADFNPRLMCELEKINFEGDQVGGIIANMMDALERGDPAVADDGFEFDHGEGDGAEAGQEAVPTNVHAATPVAVAYNKRAARLAAVAVDNSINIDAI